MIPYIARVNITDEFISAAFNLASSIHKIFKSFKRGSETL